MKKKLMLDSDIEEKLKKIVAKKKQNGWERNEKKTKPKIIVFSFHFFLYSKIALFISNFES